MKTLVLDTSPLIALYLGEPTAVWVSEQLAVAGRQLMSTVNLAECMIVLRQRRSADATSLLKRMHESSIEFVPPDSDQASLAAQARFQFPLNLGDCFAYALAKSRSLPLLTLDRDFRSTDIQVVLPPAS